MGVLLAAGRRLPTATCQLARTGLVQQFHIASIGYDDSFLILFPPVSIIAVVTRTSHATDYTMLVPQFTGYEDSILNSLSGVGMVIQ